MANKNKAEEPNPAGSAGDALRKLLASLSPDALAKAGVASDMATHFCGLLQQVAGSCTPPPAPKAPEPAAEAANHPAANKHKMPEAPSPDASAPKDMEVEPTQVDVEDALESAAFTDLGISPEVIDEYRRRVRSNLGKRHRTGASPPPPRAAVIPNPVDTP